MSAPIFPVNSIADAHRFIALLSQSGNSFRVPLAQATIDRRICHQEFRRESSARAVKLFLAAAGRSPTVCLVGDDDDEPIGPTGWPCAKRLIDWAALVIVHGTGGEREHYEAAVDVAQVTRRVLFIETTSTLVPDWIAAVQASASRPAVQLHIPPPGLKHPERDVDGQVLQ